MSLPWDSWFRRPSASPAHSFRALFGLYAPMLEIRHLETLTAIRDGGSLQEAAERLHLTQSALSHQLRDLETRLGTPLLNRRTRPARLTTAGLRVLALADECCRACAPLNRNCSAWRRAAAVGCTWPSIATPASSG